MVDAAIGSSPLLPAIITACATAISCATLSVFVVSRRWAFIGEGISHAGFGGAGTVWFLMLLFPSFERQAWAPYVGVVTFCLLTALAIGYFTRSGKINSDAAIGIFMVASLAWGFLAQNVYRKLRHGTYPAGWDNFLLGQMEGVSLQFAIGTAMVCGAVVAVVIFLGKEIVAYCFDPATAEAAGVRVGFIHYLLMVLVALTIVVVVRLMGNLLATALLVIPGATALQVTSRLRRSIAISLAVGLTGVLGGLVIQRKFDFVPLGAAIVLVLFIEFVVAYAAPRLARR